MTCLIGIQGSSSLTPQGEGFTIPAIGDFNVGIVQGPHSPGNFIVRKPLRDFDQRGLGAIRPMRRILA